MRIRSVTPSACSNIFLCAICWRRAVSRSALHVLHSKRKWRKRLGEAQSRQHRPDCQVEARALAARAGKIKTADVLAETRCGGQDIAAVVKDRAALVELTAIDGKNGSIRGDRLAPRTNHRALPRQCHQVASCA